jgi:pyridoxal phosphate enzyme (YggS family)
MDENIRRQSADIAANFDHVRRRIGEAARSSGRSAGDIEIVLVTKSHPASTLRAAAHAGLSCFGENYVQEALVKQDELGELADLSWHFIGHLQSNKASLVAGHFALIQSIDSERLARKVGEAASRLELTQSVLVQVHLGDEESKFGVAPEEALGLTDKIANMPDISLRGLMGIAPAENDPRPHFARLRSLFERLPVENRQTLSMGMSGDFEVAIREGATMVRIGTAILGQRGK